MDTDLYMSAIRSHAESMASAARIAGLDASVPTCPGWSVNDLMVHTGIVHRHKTEIVRGRYMTRNAALPDGPDGDVFAWFDAGVAEMLDVFAAADLDEPSWTWCDHDHHADWWVRRMAHETVIHAADAVIASGQVPVVEQWLAVDGVDEVLEEFMVGVPDWGTATPGGETVALESAGRRWGLRTATFSGVGPESGTSYDALLTLLNDDAPQPDAVVRTDPETLDLWLWGRRELPGASVSGDRAIVDHVRAVAVEATQ